MTVFCIMWKWRIRTAKNLPWTTNLIWVSEFSHLLESSYLRCEWQYRYKVSSWWFSENDRWASHCWSWKKRQMGSTTNAVKIIVRKHTPHSSHKWGFKSPHLVMTDTTASWRARTGQKVKFTQKWDGAYKAGQLTVQDINSSSFKVNIMLTVQSTLDHRRPGYSAWTSSWP